LGAWTEQSERAWRRELDPQNFRASGEPDRLDVRG
jgi:hypothetical protein